MSSSLATFLCGDSDRRWWLDGTDYSRRILLGDASDPWASAAEYLEFFRQAQSLVRSDIAMFDAGKLSRSWVKRHPALAGEMNAKRQRAYPLRRMVEDPGLRDLLHETLEAMTAQLHQATPLVLVLPAPESWLNEANGIARRGSMTIDEDLAEDATMYIADLARSISTVPIAGLLLDRRERPEGQGTLASYRSLINVGRHYRWSVGLRLSVGEMLESAYGADFDVVISSSATSPRGITHGLDVTSSLWAGKGLGTLAEGQFYFAEIPSRESPETVRAKLAALRA